MNNIPPSKDPLVEMLLKQGELMDSLSSNIDKESKMQEKVERKRLKKKLNNFEQKQKLQMLQDEYEATKMMGRSPSMPGGFNNYNNGFNMFPQNNFNNNFGFGNQNPQ